MSSDLVALVRRRPDAHAIADGLIAMGEPFELRDGAAGSLLLCDAEGRLLVSIEDAVQVSVQGEIGRLLGPEFAMRVLAPAWWVEVRAVADLPEAARIARRFADSLVHWLGGMVYPDGAADAPAQSWKASPQQPSESPADGAPYQGGVIG